MLKYFVLNRGDDFSVETTNKFYKQAEQHGMVLDNVEPNIVLSIGGDGTLLQAFQMYNHRLPNTSFLGVHTGHLGFFADWKPKELDNLVLLMSLYVKGNPIPTVSYPIVEIQLHTQQGTETHLALNEFTLKGVDGTLVARLDINDELFEMFRGDGICISSPAGSTAYNKSLGGAVIHPSLEALQIAEIASINNRVYRTLGSSLVLPKHHHCDIYPNEGQNILLTLDHLSVQRNDLISIRSMVASQKVSFARFRPFPFWSRVRESFLGTETEK